MTVEQLIAAIHDRDWYVNMAREGAKGVWHVQLARQDLGTALNDAYAYTPFARGDSLAAALEHALSLVPKKAPVPVVEAEDLLA